MRKITIFVALFALLVVAVPAFAVGITKNYGDVSLTGGFQSGHFEDAWDLTSCDMTISFTYDGNGLIDDSGAHAWSELGVRQIGYGDFNPTWMDEGAGVWMATDYDWTVNTFDPDPVGAPSLDMDDKFILQKGGGQGEGNYNLPSPPPNPWANHRMWWDRDGVDPWQNDETANTGGSYDVEIKLHATSDTSGEAKMSINGLDQGFETDGNWNTIELTPAGMTFSGDMKQMQVFYGLYGYGATHSIAFNNIQASGCLAPDTTAPLVEISSPLDGARLGGLIDIVGFVTDDVELSHYNLSLYPGTTDLSDGNTHSGDRIVDDRWCVIPTSGTVYRSDDFEGDFCNNWDTTQYDDGEYQIRLAARDAAGNRDMSDPDTGNTSSVHVIGITIDNIPDDKDACKKGGWELYTSLDFKNQGACVSYLMSNENAGKR